MRTRIASILLLASAMLTFEPFASLAMGPLHLHEGETTPHRDHESGDQANFIAVPVTAASGQRATQSIDVQAIALVVQPRDAFFESSVSRLLLPPGSRSPPIIDKGGTLPLLI